MLSVGVATQKLTMLPIKTSITPITCWFVQTNYSLLEYYTMSFIISLTMFISCIATFTFFEISSKLLFWFFTYDSLPACCLLHNITFLQVSNSLHVGHTSWLFPLSFNVILSPHILMPAVNFILLSVQLVNPSLASVSINDYLSPCLSYKYFLLFSCYQSSYSLRWIYFRNVCPYALKKHFLWNEHYHFYLHFHILLFLFLLYNHTIKPNSYHNYSLFHYCLS